MTGWRWMWFRAQVTGVLFSTLVWIVVWGTSLPAIAGVIAVGVGGLRREAKWLAHHHTHAGATQMRQL